MQPLAGEARRGLAVPENLTQAQHWSSCTTDWHLKILTFHYHTQGSCDYPVLGDGLPFVQLKFGFASYAVHQDGVAIRVG